MDFFRKHEKTIIWLVVIVIIPVFGIGSLLTGRSLFSGGGTAARLDGEKVTMEDLRNFIQKHNFPGTFSIDEYGMFYKEFEKAKQSGFMISEAEIRETLLKAPYFAGDDGTFSAKKYNKYLERPGMTEKLLKQAVREQLLLEKTNPGILYMLRNIIPVFVTPESYMGITQQPVPVTNDEILLKYQEENDTYKIKYAKIPVKELTKEQKPTYEEIKDIYTQARARIDADPKDTSGDGFFTDYPIRDDILKQWIVVRYLGISKSEIRKLIGVSDSLVLDYYEKNKETQYKVTKKTDADTDGKQKDEKPEYKPLDDTLKKSIESLLKDKEADRIAAIIKEAIENTKAQADNKGEPLSLQDLSKTEYFKYIEPEVGYTLEEGKAVFHGLSDPVEINERGEIWIDVNIRKKNKEILSKFGPIRRGYSRGRTDWNRAYDALSQPDPEITTDFLETANGFCMFVPVWWPNMETQEQSRPDLSYIVEFPEKKLVGIKDESDEKKTGKTKKEEDTRTVLEIKIELTKENAQIKLYQDISRQLTTRKKDLIARETAEEFAQSLTVETFDESAKKKGYKVETEGPKTLRMGGEQFKACYFLTPMKEISKVFSSTGRNGKFFGIGVLLERKPADIENIPQDKVDTLREQIRREKQREMYTFSSSLSELEWVTEPK